MHIQNGKDYCGRDFVSAILDDDGKRVQLLQPANEQMIEFIGFYFSKGQYKSSYKKKWLILSRIRLDYQK